MFLGELFLVFFSTVAAASIIFPSIFWIIESVHNSPESTRASEKISALFVIFLVAVPFIFILLKSELTGTLHFRVALDDSVIISIFGYLLFWWFSGLIPAAIVFFVNLCFCYFLNAVSRGKFETESYGYGGAVAFIAVYTAAFILVALHASGLVNINIT